jgi:hypothetical protein
MYIINLFKEISIWRKVRAVAKENEEIVNEYRFRVDWVCRMYTVINLPEEVVNQPISREGYVLMKLREYDRLFLSLGIADSIAPEMVELEGADSYLLVLSPDRDYAKFFPFSWFLIKSILLFFAIKIVYNVIIDYWQPLADFTSKFFNWLF